MTRFLTLLVGIFLLSMTPLNSGEINKIWVAPRALISNNNKIPITLLDIPSRHRDFDKSVDLVLTDPQELECMSKNIYFESALESTAGKLAVAQVTMNRVRSSWYPNTVCTVVKQGKHNESGFPVRDRCQFSWYCDGASDEIRNLVAFNTTQKIANLAMISYGSMKSQGLDYTEGAIYYHTHEINPRWSTAYPKVGRIGDHIFYR